MEVVRGVNRMLDALTHEKRPSAVEIGPVVSRFNELLQQARDQFRHSDGLRLIEAFGLGASVPLVVVRLSLMKRTIDAELARSIEEAS